MARFTSYTRKNTPADSDVILIADSADSSENKTVLLGGLWSWLTNKFSSATIGALNTTSKTVVGAINEVSQVDANLNTAGKAADAGAVGDALALKADANAVYTKAQVDNLLPTVDDELDDNSTNPVQNKVVAEEITTLRADLEAIVPGLSDEAKTALIACFSNVVWDGDGQVYINTLKTALGVADNPFEDATYEIGAFGYNQRADGSSGCVTKNDTLTTRVRTAVPVSCKHGRITAKTGYEVNLYMLNSQTYGEWASSGGSSITGYNDLAYIGTTYYQWDTEKEILTGTNYCLIVVRKTSGDAFTQQEAEGIYGTGFEYEEV